MVLPFLTLASLGILALPAFVRAQDVTVPAPNAPVSVTTSGNTYTWQSTVGFGEISAVAVDSFGDVIGGIGSAINIKDWKSLGNGSYSGTIVAQPDRGHNTQTLVNYAGRSQYFDFVFTPCTASDCTAADSLVLTHSKTMKYIDPYPGNENGGFTSGLDSSAIRPAYEDFPILGATNNSAIALDAEGLALMADGTFWTSDEYGPFIYHVAADGTILSAINPPEAVLPHLADETLSFSTLGTAPTYGRVPNQGFECLTVNPSNTILYASLQSALSQDQDLSKSNDAFARMFAWDITDPASPVLIEEYVFQLPYKKKTKTYAVSEMYYMQEKVFFYLARDGHGAGDDNDTSDLTSAFKNIGIVDFSAATNIVGQYDGLTDSIAPEGDLLDSITPATFTPFINIIDPTQIARFGIHNSDPILNDITGKFESISVLPALDASAPDDYFVFTMADNDFINLAEYVDGVDTGPDPYGANNPTQVWVYRATLPGFQFADYLLAKSLNPSGLARARRTRRAACPSYLTECATSSASFECIDTNSNIESCGGCPGAGGVDCTAVPGVHSVECVEGVCVPKNRLDSSLSDLAPP
ncbi:esterase-like activity of phytase-domain-containing protein [Pseudohyphozyma bogoriensis]|nr:esterase-like activity of phytase-domain-containing protein [Pseudohyphozyma bogoriensis]